MIKNFSVLFASAFILFAVIAICSAEDEWNDEANTNEFDNQQIYNDFLFSRQLAHEFNKRAENDLVIQTLIKRKHDAEEIKEIDAKTQARRRKAYSNYEDACKIKGKFLVRTCPPIEECFAKNKLKFVPVDNSTSKLTQVTTTLATSTKQLSKAASTTLKPSTKFGTINKIIGREFLERAIASSFFRRDRDEEKDDEELEFDGDLTEDDSESLSEIQKRFLFNKSKTSTAKITTKAPMNKELIEETKERKDKAFKKYEEYCEKRKFRIGAQRNCPPLNKNLC